VTLYAPNVDGSKSTLVCKTMDRRKLKRKMKDLGYTNISPYKVATKICSAASNHH